MASAGRILIIPKGDYSDQTTYTNLDLVFYNNTSWLCRKECKGVKPSSATSEYWFRFSAIALANNLTTNTDGYALDAKQGVVIKTNLDNLSLAINGLSDDVSALAASIDTLLSQNVAAIYDASKTYAAGDYVVYNNKLYECKTDVTVPEEFDSSKWTETYIMTSIDARVDAVLDQILDTKLSGIKGMIANEYRNDITYDVGAIVSYNGNLYKCIEDVTLAEEFDSSKWEETTMSDNLGGDAAGITYDNAKSGLKSNNVQGAVDELSSSLNGNLNMRYNPETDTIEIFYNNSWVEWRKASLLWDGIIFDNGVKEGYSPVQFVYYYAGQSSKTGFGSEGGVSYSGSEIYLNCGWGASTDVACVYIGKINLNAFTKLHFKGSVYAYSSDSGIINVIITKFNTSNTEIAKIYTKTGTRSVVSFDDYLDVSDLNDDYYIILQCVHGGDTNAGHASISQLYLTK